MDVLGIFGRLAQAKVDPGCCQLPVVSVRRRRLISFTTTKIAAASYKAQVGLDDGIQRYIDWIRDQSDIRDYFSEAEQILKSKGIVHRVKVENA